MKESSADFPHLENGKKMWSLGAWLTPLFFFNLRIYLTTARYMNYGGRRVLLSSPTLHASAREKGQHLSQTKIHVARRRRYT